MKVGGKVRLLGTAIVVAGVIGAAVFAFVASDKQEARSTSNPPGPKVMLRAADGTVVSARPFLVKAATRGAVIIHDEGADRSSTMQFAEELAKSCGCSTVAIDLRGHGQSEGSAGDFKQMHQDAEVAAKYLQTQGVKELSYIGFGSGTHVALKAAIEGKALMAVLASPPTDDKGLDSDKVVVEYKGRLLVAASEEDGDANRMASRLFERSKTGNKQYAEYKTGGHGIKLVYNTDLGKIINEMLKKP